MTQDNTSSSSSSSLNRLTPTQVAEEWKKIDTWFEVDNTGDYNVTTAELGSTLREYVQESIHGGWDGFSTRDITAIRRFLVDLMLYHKARTS